MPLTFHDLQALEVAAVNAPPDAGLVGIVEAALLCDTTPEAIRAARRRGAPYFPPVVKGGGNQPLLWDPSVLLAYAKQKAARCGAGN